MDFYTQAQINEEMDRLLSSCDGRAYPKLCRRRQTEEGLRYIKGRMRDLVLNDGITPLSATFPHIEQELSGL
jgi:hypothetical protein